MRISYIRFIFASLILIASCNTKNTEEKIHEINEELKYYSDPQLNALNDAIEDDPENPLYYYQRSKLYYEERNYSLALKDINEAISLDNLVDKFYFLLAKIYHATGKNVLALNSAKHAESLKSLDPELFIFISQLYWELKDIHNSDTYLTKATTMAPYHTEIFLLQGKVSAERGDTITAIKNFNIALQQDKENIESYKELIKIYEAKKNYDSAMTYIITGRTIDSKEPAFYYYEGKLLEHLNLKEGARSSFNASLKYDSSFYLASYSLGMMQYKDGNFNAALPYFENTIKHASNMVKADELIAEIYEKTNREVQAIPYFQRIIQLDTGNTKAKLALDRLYKIYPDWFARPKDTSFYVNKNLGLDSINKSNAPVRTIVSKEDSLLNFKRAQILKKKPQILNGSEAKENVPVSATEPIIKEPVNETPAPTSVAPTTPTPAVQEDEKDKGVKIKFKKPKIFGKKEDKDSVK